MELLLHYIWKYKLYQHELTTTEGLPIEVIDVGTSNTDAGPDFFNAKVKIGEEVWAGNIEIHTQPEDWIKHKHHLDKSYNSVILHVVGKAGAGVVNQAGQLLPQCELHVPPKLRNNYEYLLSSDIAVPCSNFIGTVPSIHILTMMESLLVERLERKSRDVFRLLDRFENSWNDVFYTILSRNFGFGLNAEPFERLALAMPLSILLKHSDQLLQMEALLFGQAGMLDDSDADDEYVLSLKREYQFLRAKYNLKPLDSFLFKKLRVRPTGSPFLRIAQLAKLCQTIPGLFSMILETEDVGKIRLFFHVNASEYWQTHYSFKDKSPQKSKYLGDASLDVILINTVAPILFAYGLKTGSDSHLNKATAFLETLRPEANSIVSQFVRAGLNVGSAYDTQAFIQLKREYCEKRKCLFCRVGHRLLKEL
ncbi:MAG: hypothetical protein H6Q14_2826 [Bacteroidetes bacterium]|nr:hypothetical protein [Bacteroidota bacterium]